MAEVAREETVEGGEEGDTEAVGGADMTPQHGCLVPERSSDSTRTRNHRLPSRTLTDLLSLESGC